MRVAPETETFVLSVLFGAKTDLLLRQKSDQENAAPFHHPHRYLCLYILVIQFLLLFDNISNYSCQYWISSYNNRGTRKEDKTYEI